MKTSNRFLLFLLLGLVAAVLSFAFYAQPYPSFIEADNFQPAAVSGAAVRDTLQLEFDYIWTDFQGVELDPTEKGKVSILSFESARDWIDVEVRHDTLFIHQVGGPYNTRFGYLRNAMMTRVIVGASGLQGITAQGWGRVTNYFESEDLPLILTEDQEYGLDGLPALQLDDLDIALINGGKVNLSLECRDLSLTIKSDRSTNINTPTAGLAGHCRRLDILHRDNFTDIIANKLIAKKVYVDSQTSFSDEDGLIKVYATENLHAEIKGWTNVLYWGSPPKVEKQEWHSGRVIDAVRYR
jgi:hypothetical protein